MDQSCNLDRKRILVVEDNFVLAREICNELRAHGASIVGPAPTAHYARLIIGARRLDGAVLDIKLFGEDVYTLADELMSEGIPMIFATAYRSDTTTDRFTGVETLHKPIDLARLVERVAAFPRDRTPPPRTASIVTRLDIGRLRPPARIPPPRESVYESWSRALSRVMLDPY